jgi:lysophospholipase L1-like esterase
VRSSLSALSAVLGGVLLIGTAGLTAAAAPSAPVTVWLAGDSTMAASAGSGIVGWGAQFRPYFTGNVTVNNSAVGGRSIQTWLYEGTVTSTKGAGGECTLSGSTYSSRWTAMLNGFRPGDYLLVQFGINDGDTACPRHVGSARFTQLLGVMAQAALARGVHPVFLTPVAAITCSGSSAVGNRGFVTETKNAASANQVPVIDLHALSVALYNVLRLCPNSSDYSSNSPVGQFFADDHTHFSAAGATQIAGVVAKAVDTQAIPLRDWLLSRQTTSTTTTSTTTSTTSTTTSRQTTTTTRPSTTSTTTTTTTTSTTTSPGGGTCTATYQQVGAWGTGFQGAVTVSGRGSAWTVTLTLASGQAVTQVWGGRSSTSGAVVTVRNETWNGDLSAGPASFGFLADGPATAPALTCAPA